LEVISLDELSQVQIFDEYEWQSVAGLYLETRTISDLHIQPPQVLSERVGFNAAVTQGAMRRYVPFTSTILETDGLRGLITTTTPQLDAVSGNLIGTTSTIPGLFQRVENYDYGNFGPLFPFGYNNRMTGRTITTTRVGNSAHVDEHQWTYDYYTGAMITDVAFANTSAPIVHEISRRGQRGEVEEEGTYFVGQAFEDQRWSVHTYDAIHVGPITSSTTWYSPDGPVQANTQVINTPSRSGPEYTIGTDGLRVDHLYDGFGRLIATSAPTPAGPVRYWKHFRRVWDLTGVPGAVYYTEVDDPGAPLMREYFDNLGRSVEKWSQVLSGAWSRSRVEYDALGRIWRTKEPGLQGDAEVWTTYGYDELERPTTVTHPLTGTSTTTYVYDSGLLTTTTTSSSGRWTSVATDATGAKVASADDGGELAYRYDSRGLLTKVLKGGVVLVEMTYDDYGHRSGLQDASAGYISYNADPLGRPLSTYSANGQTTIFHHDNLGRLVGRDGPEGTIKIVYEYDGGSRMSDRIVFKESPGVSDEFEYNELGLLTRTKRYIENEAPFSHRMEYDEWDRLLTTDYGETTVRYEYGNGLLGSVFDPVTQEAYWKGIEMDARGRYTRYALLDGLERRDYSGNHLTRIYGEATFDMRYSWDHQTGDLIDRWDAKHGVKESFLYDQLDRLTRATVNTVDQNGNVTGLVSENRFMYDGQLGATHGDLVRKDGVGKMPFYQAAAVTALVNSNWPQDLTTPPTAVNLEMQRVDYTSYHQPSRIRERVGNAEHDLTIKYGPDDQRVGSIFREANSGSVERRTYYGDHERQVLPNGSTHELIYVHGGSGLCAMIVISSGDVQRYAVHTDHLGSLVMVTRGQGQQMQYTAKQSFDPWGRPRDPITWAQSNLPAQPTWLYRGYTGHEHLQPFALINMNGRLYDPLNGRMLSVDDYIQGSLGTQGYNRFSYVGNNPLKYIDPSGEWVHIAIGAVIGGLVNWAANGGQLNGQGLAYFGVGALAGGLAAGVGAGVGAALAGPASAGGGFAAGFAGISTASSTGFVAGSFSGAAAGATSGFVQGTGNALVQKHSFNRALESGFQQAWKQGATSAILGGVLGGIDARANKLNFWTGKGEYRIAATLNPDGTVSAKKSALDHLLGESESRGHVFPDGPDFARFSNPDGTWTTRFTMPRHFELEAIRSSPNAGYLSHSISGRDLIMNSINRPEGITAIGTRPFGVPIHSLSDLIGVHDIASWNRFGYVSISTLFGFDERP
jgi:RHS repeat-associated protein